MDGPWHFTDDTVMAIGIYSILEKHGKIDQDELARVFAENYARDWHRDMEERHILFCAVLEKDRTGGKLLPVRLMEWVPWGMAAQCVLRL